uniref:Uncharacterized protein n=1 Tax=Rhipicephalus zambeziensis TaxID=60191 RepID=A0A224Y7T2_9ACAR
MATYKFFLMLVLLFAFLYCTTRRRRYGGIPNNPNIPCPNNTLSNKTCTFIQYGVTGTNGTGRRLCRRPDGGICSKLKHGYQKYGTCRNGTCAI